MKAGSEPARSANVRREGGKDVALLPHHEFEACGRVVILQNGLASGDKAARQHEGMGTAQV
jgi:hypothetical protein